MKVQYKISDRLQELSQFMVFDSVPVPVVKLVSERTYRAIKKDFETAPAKSYSAVNRCLFIGYKIHVVIFDTGVVQ